MINWLKKLMRLIQTCHFNGKTYFNKHGSQNYLIFQPFFNYFENFSGFVDKTLGRRSKWLSEESITTPATLGNSFTGKPTYIHDSKVRVTFEEKY